jgi:putative nucleotidyltransferase with HDIG domain
MKDKLDKMMKDIEKMPSLPVTVTKVLEIANNMDSTAKDLNKVISLDPVLTGKVLQLVNSAYFGTTEKINSIVKAIIMLGINTIKNLALSSAILPIVHSYFTFKKQYFFNMEGYWKHCIGVGVTSKLIAREAGINPRLLEEYFIAGIVHDIGKLVMSFHYPDDYLKAVRMSDSGEFPIKECEEEIFGISHCDIGYELAKKWKLTDELKDVILYHHNPKDVENTKSEKTVNIVYVSNIFCNQNEIGFAGNMSPGFIDNDILKELGISEEILYDNELYIENEIKKASIFMKLE